MKLENSGRYAVVSNFTSLTQLYAERSTWEESSTVIVFKADSLREVSGDDIQIQAFFRSIHAVTVLVAENIQKYPLGFLLMFDMRISDSQYVFWGSESITEDELSFYRVLCGKNAYHKLKKFIESDKKTPLESSLAVVVSNENPFYESAVQYIEDILCERTPLQMSAFVSCLVAVRNGDNEKSLTEESRYFYKTIKNKSEESDGTV